MRTMSRWRRGGTAINARGTMTATSPMVLYTHGAGRLGNQLIRFTHWMAWVRAHEGQVEVLDLAFWPYATYFDVWRQHPACLFPIRPSRMDAWARRLDDLPGWMRRGGLDRDRWSSLVHVAGRWRPGWQAITDGGSKSEGIDLDDPVFFPRVARSPVTTCSGWKIASWRLFEQYQAELRGYFLPAPEFARPAQEFMTLLRARYDVLVGVLVRQSDYRVWDGGRFFFTSAPYAGWIRQLLDLHGGRRVGVVVASVDWQDPADFGGLPVHLASGNPRSAGHWFENWVELSLCDFIVSAPSTFSATAAFVGGVPLWPVVSANQVMAHDQLISDGMVGAARHPEFSRSVK